MKNSNHHARRNFLKTLSALGMGALTPFGANLLAINQAAAQSAPTDYKALVCVFLYGGNDSHNMVIPYDDLSHANYVSKRSDIAIAKSRILPLNLSNVASGLQYGLHPNLVELAQLANSGKLAVLANTGPLYAPTSRADILANRAKLPPKLFSHNDQQSLWQSNFAEGGKAGWGGLLGELLLSQNSQAMFSNVSVAGNSLFLAGNQLSQYLVTANGGIPINLVNNTSLFGSKTAPAIMRDLLTNQRSHVMEQDLNQIHKDSITGNALLSSALASAPLLSMPTGVANHRLAQQLQMVARMIASRQALGVKRQIFFVGIGGFDTHDHQLVTHTSLYSQLSQSLGYFYNAIESLGLQNNVTTFTASDFGRTLASNGDGSDHGWGSHHLIMGGAVNAGKLYGTWPTLAMNGPDDSFGGGRLIPSTSVEQYMATLATWFGVSNSNLATVFPHLRYFNQTNLGFV